MFDLIYVGVEFDGEFVWIYFIVFVLDNMSSFVVDNDIFFGVFED